MVEFGSRKILPTFPPKSKTFFPLQTGSSTCREKYVNCPVFVEKNVTVILNLLAGDVPHATAERRLRMFHDPFVNNESISTCGKHFSLEFGLQLYISGIQSSRLICSIHSKENVYTSLSFRDSSYSSKWLPLSS